MVILILITGLFTNVGCEKEEKNTLSVNPGTIEFEKEGGSFDITIQTNAGSWKITNPATGWLELSETSGTEKTATVSLTVSTSTIQPRTDTLVITAGNANPVEVIVSQKATDIIYTLNAEPGSLSFKRTGDSTTININTDAPHWNISADADWLQLSQLSGSSGNIAVGILASDNLGTDLRTAIITISADSSQTVQITVSQEGGKYPGYNISPIEPDSIGMNSNAMEIAAEINLGLNIGNTLEAIGGETAWGNPRITKDLIDFVKASGFNAIRLPCSWNQYMARSATAKLKTDWLNRVKEVVQYCVDNDMHVLLNIHWDGGWLENNCTVEKQEENNAKQKAFWEQIATHLRDFDEHLMFASANEPNVDNATQMAVLNSYHQTFVDAVRSTGGKNSYRVLVVQGPSTDIDKTNQFMNTLPVDRIANRLMVEIHYYTPWNFCGLTADADWGKMFYYWGADYHSTTDVTRNATWGEETAVDSYFLSMKNKFVDKGIPVVLGEFSAMQRTSLTGDDLTLHLASRAYFFYYVTMRAKANGLLPFFWDTGGLINRNSYTVLDQQALDALLEGASN